MTHIEDALHGYIRLNDDEKNIIDTPEMQRLRRIRQLGLSSLVFPSATHTRFQHSLGVMHIAGRFAESLGLNDTRTKELRLAGLLHDSGHGPFSHASELVAEEHGIEHEMMSCEIVDKLEDLYSVNPDRLKRIIKGELEIGQVVAGDIDADRMDYLMRDAQKSGIEHGHIDADTIIHFAEIDSRRLVFNQKAIGALESLFTSRFHMIKTLYGHHTAVIAEKMLQRSLENYLEQGHGIRHLMEMDDYEAHNALLNAGGSAEKLYSRIKDRRLYKRALVWDEDDISREGLQSLEQRIAEPKKVEEEIAEEAGVHPRKVIVDTPRTPGIQNIDVKIKKGKEVERMADLSPIPEALADAEWRTVALKVYTPDEHKEAVADAARNVLGSYTQVLKGYME